MKIGFIGLGTMGSEASLNILRGGHELNVCDLDKSRAARHIGMGATWANTPAEATKGADIVFTMVFGPEQIDHVVRGPGGILETIGEGQIWIDMTTNSPDMSASLTDAVAARGAVAIDAPVTGAVDGARNANMTQFAGGDENAVEKARPVMELMGPVHYMGANGWNHY